MAAPSIGRAGLPAALTEAMMWGDGTTRSTAFPPSDAVAVQQRLRGVTHLGAMH